MKTILKNRAAINAIELMVVLTAYIVIYNYVARRDIISTLLSAGNHAPRLDLIVAGAFVILRLLTIVIMPGIIIVLAGSAVIERLKNKRGGDRA